MQNFCLVPQTDIDGPDAPYNLRGELACDDRMKSAKRKPGY